MKARHLSELQKSLKPCPHCGGQAALKPVPNAPMWFQVRCNAYDCGATTWAQMGAGGAVAAWNRRLNG